MKGILIQTPERRGSPIKIEVLRAYQPNGRLLSPVLSGPVLRDTARQSQRYPLLRAMGLLVSQHGQLGAIPPPPFLSVSPLESIRNGGAIPPPPPKRGISAILARYPRNQGKMRAIPPSAILSRKGIARYGGVSRVGLLSSSAQVKISRPLLFI